MKQKILFLFLFLFALQIIIPAVVFAQIGKPINFNPEVLIPGMETDASGNAATIKVDAGGNAIRSYISNFYKFGIGLTGILATITFAVGGLIWLTAGGSATQIGKAKQCLIGSITGLVLALSSYMILDTINPKIVELKWGESISALGEIGIGCSWVDRDCNSVYEKESDGSCGADPKDKVEKNYHCCCVKSTEAKYTAGKKCIDKFTSKAESVFVIPITRFGNDSQRDADSSMKCKEECGVKGLLRSDWVWVDNKESGYEESYACCLCIKDFDGDIDSMPCKNNDDCIPVSIKEGKKYTCWKDDYVCKLCTPSSTDDETYACEKDYECCSNDCRGIFNSECK